MAAKKKVSKKRRSTKEEAAAASPEQVRQVLTGISSEPSSSSELVEKTGLTIEVVRLALQELVGSKQVTKEGQKRWTRYRLAGGRLPAAPAKASPASSVPKPNLKPPTRTEVKSRAPKKEEPSSAPETAREAVLAWLGSPGSSFWENAQDVSKSLSSGSGIPRMEIQAEIRDLIKQNRIQREFCKGPEGQYRKIKRA
jgi:DNA-binding transcriptional ArsR family regulator